MGRKADPKPIRLTVTRYHAPDGKRCKRGDPGAVARRSRTESYYYRPPRKRGDKDRAIPLGTTDLQTAWERLRRLLRRQQEEAAGIRSPLLDQAERPLADHLADWLRFVADGGRRERGGGVGTETGPPPDKDDGPVGRRRPSPAGRSYQPAVTTQGEITRATFRVARRMAGLRGGFLRPPDVRFGGITFPSFRPRVPPPQFPALVLCGE